MLTREIVFLCVVGAMFLGLFIADVKSTFDNLDYVFGNLPRILFYPINIFICLFRSAIKTVIIGGILYFIFL